MYYDVYSSCTVLAMSDILKVASSNLVGINYSMNVFLRSWLQLTSVFLHPKCPWISKSEWVNSAFAMHDASLNFCRLHSFFFFRSCSYSCQYSSRHYLPASPPTLDREKLKSLLRRTHLAYINAYIPDGRIRKNNCRIWQISGQRLKEHCNPEKQIKRTLKGPCNPER